MEDKKAIENLKSGERYVIPESDYGKAEIWRVNDIYVLFEIPLFGGDPIFHTTYPVSQIKDMLNNVNNWT